MRMGTSGLFVVTALVLHGIFMVSVIDIYFRSPVTHGMQPHRSPLTPPAKRLVLFSSDGLRADKFFEGSAQDPSHAPFLRSMMTSVATWGVSHTRVPTESRPGHVAMIGGLYEDPAALLSGWQANPVRFDTVWNQSRYTWQIGSPDVVPLFSMDAPNIETHYFPPAWINFSGDPRGVDTWVYNKTKELLHSAAHNETLYSLLMSDKIVFFLHLLGMDTAGHQFRPDSPKYLEVMRNVDLVVEQLYKAFEAFWPDGSTAYIFTSDHGMSNRGSHGDGSVDETRCPLVAWGAGVASPKSRHSAKLVAAQSLTEGMVWLDGAFETELKEKAYVEASWKLNPNERVDMLQADLAPLMATLIGVPIPINSVGVMNTHYLDGSDRFKAVALLTNARQILEQCLILADRRQARSRLRYVEYPALRQFQPTIQYLYDSLNHSRYAEAHNVSQQVARQAYECVTYYNKYDWQFLRNVIAVAYLGWIICAVTYVVYNFGMSPMPARNPKLSTAFTVPVAGALFTFLVFQSSPPSHYVYCTVLLVLAAAVLYYSQIFFHGTLRELIVSSGSQGTEFDSRSALLKAIQLVATLLVHILLVEMMVYGFYQRSIYAIAFCAVGLGFGLPYVDHAPRNLRIAWFLGCLSLTPYPLLPVDAGSWPSLVIAAVVLAIALALGTDGSFCTEQMVKGSNEKRVLFLQLTCAAVQCGVCVVSDMMLKQQKGLPLVNHVVAWGCIVTSLSTLWYQHPSLLLRSRNVVLALLPLHVALSVAYECLVYVTLASLMLLWLKITTFAPPSSPWQSPVRAHLGSALLFFFWMNAAFFTTGNLASISSFELSSVYRLTTQFNVAFMTILLVLKNMIPWMAVVTPFVAFMKLQGQAPISLFALTFVYSDAMALQFFFLVQDYGSWKDIGHSISRFGIANCTILVILLLSSFASLLLQSAHSKRKE